MNFSKMPFILCLVFCLCSCYKKADWNCTCSYSNATYGSGVKTYTISQQTQPDANSTCSSYGKGLTNGNGSSSCTLKIL